MTTTTNSNDNDGGISFDDTHDDNNSSADNDREDYIEQPQKPKRTITPHLQQQQRLETSLNNDSYHHHHEEDSLSSYPIVIDQRGESISFENDKSFVDPVPKRNMSNHLLAEHEAFKLRLVDEVLGDAADDKVPMEKVVMLIWQFRDDPQVVKFMTRFVAKVRFIFTLIKLG